MLRSVIRRIVVGTVASSLTVACLYAQPMAPDRFVRISALAEAVSSSYPIDGDARVAGWFYPGEPVTVLVTLENNTLETLVLDDAPNWTESTRLVVREAGTHSAPFAHAREVPSRWSLIPMRQGDGADVVSIRPGQARRIRLALEGGADALPPGVYVLQMSADEATLPASLRNRKDLTRVVHFLGIRAVETRSDELNQAGHMAIWAAYSRKDYASAREWLQKMLRLNPSSGAAFSQLGNVAEATGNCREAIARWTKAIELISTDGDPEATPLSRSTKDDFLGGLKARIDKCR